MNLAIRRIDQWKAKPVKDKTKKQIEKARDSMCRQQKEWETELRKRQPQQ